MSTGVVVGVEEQTVGDRTDLAPQRLGRECRGVHRVGQDDDLTGAAASRVVVAEPGDRRVFGVHGRDPRAACCPGRATGDEEETHESGPAGIGDGGGLADLGAGRAVGLIALLTLVFKDELMDAWASGRVGLGLGGAAGVRAGRGRDVRRGRAARRRCSWSSSATRHGWARIALTATIVLMALGTAGHPADRPAGALRRALGRRPGAPGRPSSVRSGTATPRRTCGTGRRAAGDLTDRRPTGRLPRRS